MRKRLFLLAECALAEMRRERPQAEREKRVREAITDILKQFTPKKKK